jgi:carboxymethylenebutenolidase
MAGSNIEFPSNGGTAPGYLARPESGTGPAVVVLQEWWGLVPEIRDVCDRFAEAGFVALAPDLYRGETASQPDEAQQKMMAMSMEQTEKDLRGAIDFVAQEAGVEKVGTVGFCLGGGLSVFAASLNPKVAACVSYYYVMPHAKPDFSKITAPVLMHFGTDDAFMSQDDVNGLVEEMRAAGVEVRLEWYEGAGHAFFNKEDRLGTYNAEAAERSWQITTEFFNENL